MSRVLEEQFQEQFRAQATKALGVNQETPWSEIIRIYKCRCYALSDDLTWQQMIEVLFCRITLIHEHSDLSTIAKKIQETCVGRDSSNIVVAMVESTCFHAIGISFDKVDSIPAIRKAVDDGKAEYNAWFTEVQKQIQQIREQEREAA